MLAAGLTQLLHQLVFRCVLQVQHRQGQGHAVSCVQPNCLQEISIRFYAVFVMLI